MSQNVENVLTSFVHNFSLYDEKTKRRVFCDFFLKKRRLFGAWFCAYFNSFPLKRIGANSGGAAVKNMEFAAPRNGTSPGNNNNKNTVSKDSSSSNFKFDSLPQQQQTSASMISTEQPFTFQSPTGTLYNKNNNNKTSPMNPVNQAFPFQPSDNNSSTTNNNYIASPRNNSTFSFDSPSAGGTSAFNFDSPRVGSSSHSASKHTPFSFDSSAPVPTNNNNNSNFFADSAFNFNNDTTTSISPKASMFSLTEDSGANSSFNMGSEATSMFDFSIKSQASPSAGERGNNNMFNFSSSDSAAVGDGKPFSLVGSVSPGNQNGGDTSAFSFNF